MTKRKHQMTSLDYWLGDHIIETSFIGAILLVGASYATVWLLMYEPTDFMARQYRCQYLAHKADGNLSRADVPQMIEDCMDDGGPVEELSVR